MIEHVNRLFTHKLILHVMERMVRIYICTKFVGIFLEMFKLYSILEDNKYVIGLN